MFAGNQSEHLYEYGRLTSKSLECLRKGFVVVNCLPGLYARRVPIQLPVLEGLAVRKADDLPIAAHSDDVKGAALHERSDRVHAG